MSNMTDLYATTPVAGTSARGSPAATTEHRVRDRGESRRNGSCPTEMWRRIPRRGSRHGAPHASHCASGTADRSVAGSTAVLSDRATARFGSSSSEGVAELLRRAHEQPRLILTRSPRLEGCPRWDLGAPCVGSGSRSPWWLWVPGSANASTSYRSRRLASRPATGGGETRCR